MTAATSAADELNITRKMLKLSISRNSETTTTTTTGVITTISTTFDFLFSWTFFTSYCRIRWDPKANFYFRNY